MGRTSVSQKLSPSPEDIPKSRRDRGKEYLADCWGPANSKNMFETEAEGPLALGCQLLAQVRSYCLLIFISAALKYSIFKGISKDVTVLQLFCFPVSAPKPLNTASEPFVPGGTGNQQLTEDVRVFPVPGPSYPPATLSPIPVITSHWVGCPWKEPGLLDL
jgi:hypothetical protein